jgi:hypothetical protein
MATIPDAQRRLVERLHQRLLEQAHGHGVERIETALSWVLVTPTEAFKIKKAVDLGFVDQRRREARRQACETEVRLNRRTAPSLYLGVRGLDADAQWVLPDDRQAVDHAVHMRRFDPAATLDRLLDVEHGLPSQRTEAWIDQLVDQVVAMHAQARHAIHGGLIDDLRRATHETPASWRVVCSGPEQWDRVDSILHAIGERELALDSLCRQRRSDGFVRECHGDLHLGNACVFDGQVTVFDAIDFCEPLRTLDVMHDLAFLLMDLHVRGQPQLAWRALSRYLDATGDHAGVPVLKSAMAWRALIRFKVAKLSGRPDSEALAERYLDGAFRLLAPRSPVLVAMQGVSGSGKSAVSQRLLGWLGAVRLRSDVERHRMAAAGEPADYSPESRDAVYDALFDRAEGLLRAGHRVVLDATFLRRDQRERVRELAERLQLPWAWVQCEAPVEVMLARLAARQGDASEADARVLMQQLSGFPKPFEEGEATRLMHVSTTLPLSHWETSASWLPLWRLLGLSQAASDLPVD